MIGARSSLALFACSLALLAACTTTDPEATRCTDIPANGCPLAGSADVCADPSCEAAYACNPGGSWTLDHTCPGFHPADAGQDAGPNGGQDAGPSLTDASGCIDAGLPPGASPSGGSQCLDLQPPDCPLSEVLLCGSSGTALCASTGCQQLFVCEANGWQIWGECDDGGVSIY